MSFSITFEPSGRVFQAESSETVLDAGIKAGLALPYGCKDGACGSCKCKKIAGEVQHTAHQEKALSVQEEADGFVLTCCAKPLSDLVLESKQVGALGAFPVLKMPTRVASLKKVSDDVMIIELQLPASTEFKYHSGQYIEFALTGGFKRAYSIANASHNGPLLELHIRHMPGGRFTDHVFARMQNKEILRMEGPFGSFYLREESQKPIVLLASGTGFAPIKAILETMQHQSINRPVTLFWGGRRPADLYMNDWVETQKTLMPQLRYIPVISNALEQDAWSGATGFVHQAVMQEFPDLSGHEVYACGAPIVVESAQKDFVELCGLHEENFFADSFISEADKVK